MVPSMAVLVGGGPFVVAFAAAIGALAEWERVLRTGLPARAALVRGLLVVILVGLAAGTVVAALMRPVAAGA